VILLLDILSSLKDIMDKTSQKLEIYLTLLLAQCILAKEFLKMHFNISL